MTSRKLITKKLKTKKINDGDTILKVTKHIKNSKFVSLKETCYHPPKSMFEHEFH